MDSNLTNIGYVEEVTFGTTPTANMQLLRRTGGNLRPNQGTVTSEEIRSDLRAGKPVRTSQMAAGDINVEWSYATLDDILEGMLMNSWSSDVLVDGTTKKSFTFEEQFLGSSPAQYMIYKGCRIASLSMSFGLDSIVSGSFGVMASTPSIAQASAGTGNTAPTSTTPWNTIDFVTGLTEGETGGSPTALPQVTGVEINLDRSLRAKRGIGDLNPFDIGVGRLLVTGQITQYFQDDRLMDAYFAFTDRELNITVEDDDGNEMLIEIPRLKFVGEPNIENPGPDSDRLVTMAFEAYALASDAALISFTRTDA